MHESLAKALAAKGLTAEADEETRRARQSRRRNRRMAKESEAFDSA